MSVTYALVRIRVEGLAENSNMSCKFSYLVILIVLQRLYCITVESGGSWDFLMEGLDLGLICD